MDDTKDTIQSDEAYFKYSIQIALENKFSWITLASMLDQMTPTLSQSKELVRVLLKELQNLQRKHQELVQQTTISSEDIIDRNYDVETLEEIKFDASENDFVKDTKKKATKKQQFDTDVKEFENAEYDFPFHESRIEHKEKNSESEEISEIEEESFVDAQNFDDNYDFIGSDCENETLDQTEDFTFKGESPRKSEFGGKSNKRKKDSNAKQISMNSQERNYECKVCKEKFPVLRDLKWHERLQHTGEKSFQCRHCKMKFTQSSNLKSHERTIHSGEKPFECKNCKKKFANKHNLKIHERTHTGEKPFACKYCKRCFAHHNSLVIHERGHTGEEPYECENCAKRFRAQSNLKIHERHHTGEMPYKCSECGKRFKDPSNLNHHQKTHIKI